MSQEGSVPVPADDRADVLCLLRAMLLNSHCVGASAFSTPFIAKLWRPVAIVGTPGNAICKVKGSLLSRVVTHTKGRGGDVMGLKRNRAEGGCGNAAALDASGASPSLADMLLEELAVDFDALRLSSRQIVEMRHLQLRCEHVPSILAALGLIPRPVAVLPPPPPLTIAPSQLVTLDLECNALGASAIRSIEEAIGGTGIGRSAFPNLRNLYLASNALGDDALDVMLQRAQGCLSLEGGSGGGIGQMEVRHERCILTAIEDLGLTNNTFSFAALHRFLCFVGGDPTLSSEHRVQTGDMYFSPLRRLHLNHVASLTVDQYGSCVGALERFIVAGTNRNVARDMVWFKQNLERNARIAGGEGSDVVLATTTLANLSL